MMRISKTSKRVVRRLLSLPETTEEFGDDKAIEFAWNNDNAWLLAVIFNQSVPYERALRAPSLLKRRLGHLNMRRIAGMPVKDLQRKIRGEGDGALHRYWRTTGRWVRAAARKVTEEYAGDAARIWRPCRTAAELIARLCEFDGISLKKAHWAARVLNDCDESVELTGWSAINVAVDVHVRRVWCRTGLTSDSSTAAIMRRASELYPRYPGRLDEPSWQIGVRYCRPTSPLCSEYPLHRDCPRIGVTRPRHGAHRA